MPEARTLLEATIEAGNLARAAAARCTNVFNSQYLNLNEVIPPESCIKRG